MAVVLFLLILLFLCYAVLMLFYRAGWKALPDEETDRAHEPRTKVSLIIPARNEEKNLPQLLRDVQNQHYPPGLLEIIVVDDHSTDATVAVAESFGRVRCLRLCDYTNGEVLNAYKKKAIETAIAQSTGELIVTTDADCRVGPWWLHSLVSFYERKQARLIAAPVYMDGDGSVLSVFQTLDFMTMQGITGAVVHTRSGTLCNGANLAYTKQAFETVGGFKGIDHIASGDDMLLMHKIEQRFPRRTHYLKNRDATVRTAPMPDLASFFRQRIRWASKATHFRDRRLLAVLGLVYAYNLSFLLITLAAFRWPALWLMLLCALLAKTLLELSLVRPLARFFGAERLLLWFPLLQLLHIPYIVLSGLFGQFGAYRWKDRRVR